MFTSIHFNRRRPGMSPEAYRDYYENHHSKLGAEFVEGYALSYTRTYLYPMNPGDPAPIYDSVMMLCFPDRDAYERATGRVANDPGFAKLFMEDELKLFDRPAGRSFASEDISSTLPPVPHGDDLFRTVWFGRRRPEMTRDQCKAYYETKHRLLGEYIMGGWAINYDRHYLHSFGPGRPEPDYDFIMEMNFPSRERFDAMTQSIVGNPALAQLLAQDEDNYLDRSWSVHYRAETCQSVLAPLAVAAE
jgi:hypothetical protein